MPVSSTNVPGLTAVSSSSDAMSISLSRSESTSSVSSLSHSVSTFGKASLSLSSLTLASAFNPSAPSPKSKSISRSPRESFSGNKILSFSKSNDDSPKWTLKLCCKSTDTRRASRSGDTPRVAPGRSWRRVGEGDGGAAAGVTAMIGVGCDDSDDGLMVPFIALMTDARGDEDGAGVGRVRRKDDGDPNSAAPAGPPFWGIDIGLLRLLLSPSAMSARGRRWGVPCASPASCCTTGARSSWGTSSSQSSSSSSSLSVGESYDMFVSLKSIRRPLGNG